MAQKTTLAPYAWPGRVYNFVAKEEQTVEFITIDVVIYGPKNTGTIETGASSGGILFSPQSTGILN